MGKWLVPRVKQELAEKKLALSRSCDAVRGFRQLHKLNLKKYRNFWPILLLLLD